MGVDLSSWAQGGTLSYQQPRRPAETAGLESPGPGPGGRKWGLAPTLAATAVSFTWLSPQVWGTSPSSPGDLAPSLGGACQAFLSAVLLRSSCPVLCLLYTSSTPLPACAVGFRLTPVPGMPCGETPLMPGPSGTPPIPSQLPLLSVCQAHLALPVPKKGLPEALWARGVRGRTEEDRPVTPL